MPRIAVTGSVAFDLLARFSGRFADSLLPDQLAHINVSFLVDDLERRRGGTAAHIAYTLALLGDRPLLCAAVGTDFDDYQAALTEAGVDTTAAWRSTRATASCFITTDSDQNQITAFYPGAMSEAAALDLTGVTDIDCVVVSPDSPDAMGVHIAQTRALGHRLVFSPAQQLPALSDEVLLAGLEAAWLIVGNVYELGLVEQRTGRSVAQLAAQAIVAVTRGAEGSHIHRGEQVSTIPAATPHRVVDPTGAGDAYLAGVLYGLRANAGDAQAGRFGSLAATYVVEQHGPQAHGYTRDEFERRYAAAFGTEVAATV